MKNKKTNLNTHQANIPAIFEAKTYFWIPGQAAWQRRKNEERRYDEARTFFCQYGFKYNSTTKLYELIFNSDKIEVDFSYEESCKIVYKELKVFKNGKKSNITTLRKLMTPSEIRKLKIEKILNSNNQ